MNSIVTAAKYFFASALTLLSSLFFANTVQDTIPAINDSAAKAVVAEMYAGDTSAISAAYTDSRSIDVHRPSKSKEDLVFSDAKLKYKTQTGAAPGGLGDFLEWLTRKLFGKVESGSVSKTRSLLLWSLFIISAIVIVRLLLRSELVGLTRPSPKATSFNFSDVGEDLGEVNFDQRVAEALNENDYRLATRWLYLKMLFLLDKKQHIFFAPHKTNVDYRYEIKDKALMEDFKGLSRVYEYVWYGQFVVTPERYESNAREFGNFEKRLNA